MQGSSKTKRPLLTMICGSRASGTMSWRPRHPPVMAVRGQMAVRIFVVWSSRLAGHSQKFQANNDGHFLIQCRESAPWRLRQFGESPVKQADSTFENQAENPAANESCFECKDRSIAFHFVSASNSITVKSASGDWVSMRRGWWTNDEASWRLETEVTGSDPRDHCLPNLLPTSSIINRPILVETVKMPL